MLNISVCRPWDWTRKAVATVLVVFAVGAAPAQALAGATCKGKDMLAELAGTDPAMHTRIMQEAAKVENASAMLWKVERKGVPPSHLFGTIHMTDERVSVLPERLKTVIAGSKQVVLEVADLTSGATEAAMMRAMDKLVFMDGRSLADHLTPEEFTKAVDVLGKAGVPKEAVGAIRPWVLGLMLALSDCERRQVESGKPVLDMRVGEAAKAHGITVTGLETADEQINAMASVPEDEQVQVLRAALAFSDRADDMMETLVQLYLKRQIGAAWAMQTAFAEKAGQGKPSFNGFKQELVVARNKKMRDGMIPLLAKGHALIAVGALHLTGKEGLVTLLREAGYTVTPLE